MDDDTTKALKAALAAGRKEQQLRRQEKMKEKARQGCWNGRGTVRGSSTNTFGEGLGNSLGLDPPKYTDGSPKGDFIPEQERPRRTPEQQAIINEKSRRTREKNKATKALRQAMVESGKSLQGQRVFITRDEWRPTDWDIRAKRVGGIPEGVDVAHSEWATVLLIPVIEAGEAKELGVDTRWQDPEGRGFTVREELVQTVETIFGRIKWERPLTTREAKQFGVRIK